MEDVSRDFKKKSLSDYFSLERIIIRVQRGFSKPVFDRQSIEVEFLFTKQKISKPDLNTAEHFVKSKSIFLSPQEKSSFSNSIN